MTVENCGRLLDAFELASKGHNTRIAELLREVIVSEWAASTAPWRPNETPLAYPWTTTWSGDVSDGLKVTVDADGNVSCGDLQIAASE